MITSYSETLRARVFCGTFYLTAVSEPDWVQVTKIKSGQESEDIIFRIKNPK